MIEFKATSKGYIVGSFRDRYGAECSIQESSYPDEPCVWLGVEVDSGGEAVVNGRMHLSKEGASDLIEVLRHFVNEDSLGQYGPEDFRVGSWVKGVGKNNYSIVGRVIQAQVPVNITIQDQGIAGDRGIHVCLWSEAQKLWEPTVSPEAGRTLYEHLDDWED